MAEADAPTNGDRQAARPPHRPGPEPEEPSATDSQLLVGRARPEPECDDEPPPAKVGNYTIQGVIDRGGMGIVYLGRDERLERLVALKALPRSAAASRERRTRFEREAKLLALTDHPNIAAIHAIEELEGRMFLVLEYVPGITLRSHIEQGPLAPVETVGIGLQIAQALEAAHARGVVHRDLKPANVRITPDGMVKVLDFGLAKLRADPDEPARATKESGVDDPELSVAGVVMGTLDYLSPEQLRGSPADARVDVWAFGCVLYECLTGCKTWGAGSPAARIQAIKGREPDWDALPAATPPELRSLVQSCLVKDPPLRLRGMAAARRALEAIQERLGARPRAAGVRRVRRGNLPKQFTPCIGRLRERAELREDLARPGLVTLAGMGGCGKTRLALDVAEELEPSYRHGAWFVDLGPLDAAGPVLQTIAAALGLADRAGQPLERTLEQYLADKELLLLLDSCERHLEAVAALAGAIRLGCPEVSILATSREPLGLPGEVAIRIAPLEVPATATTPDLAELRACEAVELFVARVRALVPGFELDASNADAVAAICRRVDGIPLAIELAASRVSALSVQQIAARLSDRLGLLTGGARTAPARHQTLRALFDWSHDQLEEPERALLRRLSIFAGGFELESAEAVCSGGTLLEADVLDGLTQLIRHSLVALERRHDVVRYRILDTLRDYGRERLREAGEESSLSERFVASYVALAESAEVPLAGPDQARWLDRLEDDHANIRQAIELCLSQPHRIQRGLRIAVALDRFWIPRSHLREGRSHLLKLLAAPEAAAGSELRERGLNAAGRLTLRGGDAAEAERLHAEALSIASTLGSRSGRARSHAGLGETGFHRGELALALSHLEEGLRLSRQLGDASGVARGLSRLGSVERTSGQREAARSHWRQALTAWREVGDRRGVAIELSNLAVLELHHDGEYESIRSLLLESLAIRREIRDQHGILLTQVNLAANEFDVGNHEAARSILESILPSCREAEGGGELTAAVLNNLAAIDLKTRDCAALVAHCAEGLANARRVGAVHFTLNLLENAARGEAARGQLELSAQMTGAADRARVELGLGRTPVDATEQQALLATLTSGLGAAAYAAALAAGARLSLSEAADLWLQTIAR